MTHFKRNSARFFSKTCLLFCSLCVASVYGQQNKRVPNINIKWDKIIGVSKTTTTLQLVENPMVRPGSFIHKQTFAALKELGADYVRYVPWFPYPKMSVAALKPPTKDRTFWDFTYLDSTM